MCYISTGDFHSFSKNAAAEYVECEKEETILEIIKSVISKNANPDIPHNSEGHEGKYMFIPPLDLRYIVLLLR